MAFLWVELNTIDIPETCGAGKSTSIIRRSNDILVVMTLKIIRMKEIKNRAPVQTAKQFIVPHRLNVVPAHMGEKSAVSQSRSIELPYYSIDPTKAVQTPFLARVCQHLHTDADAKHRNL